MQFLHCQLQPTGALARLRLQQPLLVMALWLSALTYDATSLDKPAVKRSSTTALQYSSRAASGGGVGSAPRPMHHGLRRRRATAQGEVAKQFLLSTAYVRAWPDAERAELLHAVGKVNEAMGNPTTFRRMLEREETLLPAERDMFLLQTTLMVASNSHIFRQFRTHTEWCEFMFGKLKDVPVSFDMETPFCFKAGDSSSERFARSHSWVLRHVMLPFVAMWARAAQVPEAQRLFSVATRMMGSYKMLCADPRKLGGSIHASAPVRQRASLDETSMSKLKSPLANGNQDEIEIPYDSTGMLSVCKMYGVNIDSLLFVRRGFGDLEESTYPSLQLLGHINNSRQSSRSNLGAGRSTSEAALMGPLLGRMSFRSKRGVRSTSEAALMGPLLQ